MALDLFFFGYLCGLLFVSYAAGKVLPPIVLGAFSALVARTKTSLDDRIIKGITAPLESFFFLFIVYAGVKAMPVLSSPAAVLDRYVTATLVLVLTYLAITASKAFYRWYYEEGHVGSKIKVDLSLIPFLQKFTRLVIALVGFALFLGELGYELTGLLALTGVVGIILGLASQESLANIFAGLALQMDRPYAYGDYLRLPSGEIVRLRKIGIRSTKLVDSHGNEIISSNSEFAKLRVTKIGSARSKDVLEVYFEAPIALESGDLRAQLSMRLKKKRLEGISEGDIRVTVTSVKAPGWYEAVLYIPVEDLGNSVAITHEVNTFIAGKIRGTLSRK